MNTLRVYMVSFMTAMTTFVAYAVAPMADEFLTARQWAATKLEGAQQAPPHAPSLDVRANHDPLQKNGRFGTPLKLGKTECTNGLYCHATSEVIVRLPEPGKTFTATIGVDSNDQTIPGKGSVVFVVSIAGKELFRSDLIREGMPGVPVNVDLAGAKEFTLAVTDGGDGISSDQADWADAEVTLANGKQIAVADLPLAQNPALLDQNPLPFSFVYGGESSSAFLNSWKQEHSSKKLDDTRIQHEATFTDPKTGLVVRCSGVEYTDFPTVEWTLYFKNTGKADTPLIENIQALDVRLERGDTGEFLLHHFVGSPCHINDYEPLETTLASNTAKRITGARGRATSSDMCYFNVQSTCNDGMIIGLGWPGQWAAEFKRDGGKTLQITAGQETTRLKLLPGEEVRTPLVVLQFWNGDWIRSQNIWRRWMMAHNMPQQDGKPVQPFVTADTSAQFGEMIGADEEKEIYFVDRYLEERLKIEYWWMDAGWYPCDGSWPKTGTWEVDTKRFPRGLRAVSDHAHKNGIKIIVWFEPERVAAGTWLTETHPEWIIGGKGGGLLNLGNPDAVEWLTEHVDKLLTDQGIDLYRQDFNMDPLDAWHVSDAALSPAGDRQGITENKHIAGLFEYWDGLIRRHPGLIIDTCASGGRRNDLETLRRAIPLWRTDFPFDPIATQCHTYGISFWIPLSGTGVKVIDNYDFRSNAAPEFTCHWDLRDKALDYNLMRRQLDEWRRYSPNFMGDYYPLSPYSTDKGAWMAWQFDRPEAGEGMVQVFRRRESIYLSAAIPLKGLVPEANYEITDLDTPGTETMTGRELMDKGFVFTIPDRAAALVLMYKRMP